MPILILNNYQLIKNYPYFIHTTKKTKKTNKQKKTITKKNIMEKIAILLVFFFLSESLTKGKYKKKKTNKK